MYIIDGHSLADKILEEIKEKLANKKLAVLLATNDKIAHHYVELKKRKAQEFGVSVEIKYISTSASTAECIEVIDEWNTSNEIDGILVQLPIYKHLNKFAILNRVIPKKDVDGLGCIMQGKISQLAPNSFLPATVEAILEALNVTTDEDISWDKITSNTFNPDSNFFTGKQITIVNNSNLIGIPLANVLAKCNATVTITNKHSNGIKKLLQNSDIVVTATGKTQIFDHTFFKTNATIIDVTSKNINKKVYGDIIYTSELKQKINYLTPVPGGIGPLTIACLLRNLVKN
jgi:methylenetetrahydrofolate dehydrogenase (NADP+)/methenyltetrahydrofolate cyclohydrolase